MLTVREYIEGFALEYEHPYEDSVILKYINIVEGNLDVIKDYRIYKYAMVMGEYQYELPAGIEFENVYGLRVNGARYKKVDVREYKKLRTYWFENGKLCIYPACSNTDDPAYPQIRLVYKYRPTKKLMATIDTDELYIPDKHIEIYDFFLMAKISYLQKEYQEHHNHMMSFNSAVNTYVDWWDNYRPQRPEEEMVSSEDTC